jgi:hypothetical protein
MQTNEENAMQSALKKLSSMSRGLSFETGQAWTLSTYYIGSYLKEHADNGAGLSSDNAAMMGVGRLDWLLRQSRPTLNGLFSESDIFDLIRCYQGSVFFPDQLNCIASDLCDHIDIDIKKYANTTIGSLIERLLSLSPVQRVTLADALEQTWHRGMSVEKKQPREFLESIGIQLK